MRPLEAISKMNGKCWFLLDEFPAETRLTVHHRLDMEWKSSPFSKSNTETVAELAPAWLFPRSPVRRVGF